jgi:hypothetical protein
MTEKRRAEDEMRRRNRELNALNAMAVVAAQSFDLGRNPEPDSAPGRHAVWRGERNGLPF